MSEVAAAGDRPSSLDEDLLVEVASFLPRGSTLLNICVALGLGKSAAVRNVYLRKNYHFLEEAMKGYRTATWRTWGRQKAAVDIRAWMEANDWETVCDSFVVSRKMSCPFPRDSVAFLKIFSPMGGIELGLLEVLKFFVEGNMNEYIRSYGAHREEEISKVFGISSLLLRSFYSDNFEAFEYLLSRVDDIESVSDLLWLLVFSDGSFVIDSTKYFEAIVSHPDFSPNAEFLAQADGMTISCAPLPIIIASFYSDFARGCLRGGLFKKLEILLEAGADPNLPTVFPTDGAGLHISPLEFARIMRDALRFRAWRSQGQAVVDVMTDHVLARSMAELSLGG